MPKMKTKKALLSRFKRTGTGKLLRHKQGRRHILSQKSSNRKRRLKRVGLVSDGYLKTYKELMGCV